MFENLLSLIAVLVNEYPLLAFLILLCLLGCSYRLIMFIFNTDFLGILACLGQTLPLAMALYFHNIITANWWNSVTWVILFVIAVFLILAFQIYNYISKGPTDAQKQTIRVIGFIGLFTWMLLFFQTFPDLRFWEQLPPPQSSQPRQSPPPSLPIGRP